LRLTIHERSRFPLGQRRVKEGASPPPFPSVLAPCVPPRAGWAALPALRAAGGRATLDRVAVADLGAGVYLVPRPDPSLTYSPRRVSPLSGNSSGVLPRRQAAAVCRQDRIRPAIVTRNRIPYQSSAPVQDRLGWKGAAQRPYPPRLGPAAADSSPGGTAFAPVCLAAAELVDGSAVGRRDRCPTPRPWRCRTPPVREAP
jgi:hypothetical protein